MTSWGRGWRRVDLSLHPPDSRTRARNHRDHPPQDPQPGLGGLKVFLRKRQAVEGPCLPLSCWEHNLMGTVQIQGLCCQHSPAHFRKMLWQFTSLY